MVQQDPITVQPGETVLLDGSMATSAIDNDGILECGPADTESLSGPISGDGVIQLDAQARLFLDAPSIGPDQGIRFEGPNALIVLESGCDALPVLEGFDAGDGIQLDQGAVDLRAGCDGSGDATVTVTLLDGSIATFRFDGDYAGRDFALETQRLGLGPPVLRVSDAVACYCPGTRLATDHGEAPIETLRIGDLVRVASGGLEPIVWIGRRTYARRFVAGRKEIVPVRIRAGALGGGLPRRALFVSPRHAMLVDGVLVPASLLVNGVSVTQPEPESDVAYLHVELNGHHLLLAEGTPAESFVDDDSRAMFQNCADYRALYPDRIDAAPVWCAPLVEHGPALLAAKRRIDALAGLIRDARAPELRGRVDEASAAMLRGWAWCPAHPNASVCLEVLSDGVPVHLLLADRYRADLEAAGIGTGCHGFELVMPDRPPVGRLTVRRALDGAILDGAG